MGSDPEYIAVQVPDPGTTYCDHAPANHRRCDCSAQSAPATQVRSTTVCFYRDREDLKDYEYAVLVTSLPNEALTIVQLYRDRADCDKVFDEMKNQWGWGDFVIQDIKRSRLRARMIALIYNWWNLFVRLTVSDKYLKAFTSRPLLLNGVGKLSHHCVQQTLTITHSHGRHQDVRAAYQRESGFLFPLKRNAPQLSPIECWYRIPSEAFRSFSMIGNYTRLMCFKW